MANPWEQKWGATVAPVIAQVAKKLGLNQVPLEYDAQGRALDLNGNVIPNAPSYQDYQRMVNDVVNNGVSIDQLVLPSMPGGRQATTAQPNQTGASPQSGLAGSEAIMQAGGALAVSELERGLRQGGTDLIGAVQDVKAQQQASNQQIAQGAYATYDAARQPIEQAQAGALATSGGRFDQAVAPMGGYAQGGNAAFNLQSALSGAFGPEAQQQAYQNFSQSPGQQYLVDQSEKALLRNQAAIGGLGGGNVRQELQQNAIGLAAQDYGNQYNRLAGLSGMGQSAAGQISQLRGAQAGLESGIIGSTGQQLGGIASGLGQTVLGQVGATNQAGMGITSQLGQAIGNLGATYGTNAANIISGLTSQAGQQRYDAGKILSQNLGGANTALANLQNIQGSTLADLYGAYGSNLAGLLQQTGQGVSGADQQLAAILANIATGQGSQAGGLPGIPGIQQGADPMQQIGSAAGGLGGLAMGLAAFSDARLKTNIKRTGTTAGGVPWYKWDWLIDTDQPAFGVLAQENPNASTVGPDGYLRVDYARVH